MRFDKLTIKAQEALQSADSISHRYDHAVIDAEHLLLALLDQKDGIIAPLLQKLGANQAALASDAEKAASSKPKVSGDSVQRSMSPELARILNQAESEAEKLKDEYTSTEHILLGFLDVESPARHLLASHGVTRDGILAVLKEIRGNTRVTDQNPEDKYQVLERFCRDLTDLARREKIGDDQVKCIRLAFHLIL